MFPNSLDKGTISFIVSCKYIKYTTFVYNYLKWKQEKLSIVELKTNQMIVLF